MLPEIKLIVLYCYSSSNSVYFEGILHLNLLFIITHFPVKFAQFSALMMLGVLL